MAEACSLWEDAIQLAESIHDSLEMRETKMCLAFSLMLKGKLVEAKAVYSEIKEFAEQKGYLRLGRACKIAIAACLMWQGHYINTIDILDKLDMVGYSL